MLDGKRGAALFTVRLHVLQHKMTSADERSTPSVTRVRARSGGWFAAFGTTPESPGMGRGTTRRTKTQPARLPPPPSARPQPPPPWWRDPWALAVALAVVPVLVAMRGGLPGEPVADDFGFLHDSWLSGRVDWLSGGGRPLSWRPLSRQLYYRVLGPLLLSHPYAVALLHAACLALAGVLLYRALRPARAPAPRPHT